MLTQDQIWQIVADLRAGFAEVDTAGASDAAPEKAGFAPADGTQTEKSSAPQSEE